MPAFSLLPFNMRDRAINLLPLAFWMTLFYNNVLHLAMQRTAFRGGEHIFVPVFSSACIFVAT